MEHQPDRVLEPAEQILLLTQIGWELDAEVKEQNQMSRLTDMVRDLRGSRDRVANEVGQAVDEVKHLERQVGDLAKAAAAPQLKELNQVKAELQEAINELAELTNGGPPLDGSPTPSASSSQS